MTTLRRVLSLGLRSLVLGGLLALVPAMALAEDPSRALPVSADATMVFAYTAAAVGGVMLVAALGWLYQQKRGLHWDFQGDASHGNDHH